MQWWCCWPAEDHPKHSKGGQPVYPNTKQRQSSSVGFSAANFNKISKESDYDLKYCGIHRHSVRLNIPPEPPVHWGSWWFSQPKHHTRFPTICPPLPIKSQRNLQVQKEDSFLSKSAFTSGHRSQWMDVLLIIPFCLLHTFLLVPGVDHVYRKWSLSPSKPCWGSHQRYHTAVFISWGCCNNVW